MGFFDTLFGRKDDRQTENNSGYGAPRGGYRGPDVMREPLQRPQNADEQAIARYKYMLQTAPPEDIERAHEEAFARLTPEQRRMVLDSMSREVPESERAMLSDDPRSMARVATRAEMRQPGSMNRMFGGAGGNMGGGMGAGMMGGGMGMMGGMLAGSLLASVAGGFIGSSIANSFFSNPANESAFQGSPEAAAVDGGVTDYGDSGFQETGLSSDADPYGDPGAEGFQEAGLGSDADPYGDPGADSGGFMDAGFDGGGDFGGDFGGGDF